MKVIWGKFSTGVNLILCAACDYYIMSILIKEKAQIQSYSLKESIILLIEMMFFFDLAAAGIVSILRQIYIYEWGIKLSFWGYEKKIE